jgi:hypothetical protein
MQYLTDLCHKGKEVDGKDAVHRVLFDKSSQLLYRIRRTVVFMFHFPPVFRHLETEGVKGVYNIRLANAAISVHQNVHKNLLMHLFYQKPYQLYGKMKKVNKPRGNVDNYLGEKNK